DVVIGEDSSVWPCAVVRGDVHYIRIGARTNIQDGSVLHVMRDERPLILGDDVTDGHSVTLHGCTIESRCLMSMGVVILNGVTLVPIFETTELFARSIGLDTDVVSKEMYTFEDYEATELVELRTAVVTNVASLATGEALIDFLDRVGNFILAAEKAFEAGRIPKTPENERTLQMARELTANLQAFGYQGEREILPRVAELKDAVRQVRFGDV